MVKRVWWMAGVAVVALGWLGWSRLGSSSEENRAVAESRAGAGSTEQRVAAVEKLGQFNSPRVRTQLQSLTRDTDLRVAARAVQVLAPRAGAEDVREFRAFLGDPHPELREAAAVALAVRGDETDVPALIRQLSGDASPEARAAAAHALGVIKDCGAVIPALLAALQDPNVQVRTSAKAAITAIVGLNFAYRADMPEVDRKRYAGVIEAWWQENGAKYVANARGTRR